MFDHAEALVISAGEAMRLSPVAYDSSGTPLPGRQIRYRSRDTSVVRVDDVGEIRAARPGRTMVVLSSGGVVDSIPVAVVAAGGSRARIELFPGRTFQRMEGWEAHHQSGEIDCNPVNFARYQEELFDRAVDELGLNRLRLEVRSGMEAPDLRDPGGNEPQSTDVPFGTPWFTPVNDNDDPSVADLAGFQFGWFDYNIESSVLPLRERLAKRGERLYLNLTYVDFGRLTPFEQLQNPEEYAELIAVTFDHMQRRFGFVPDAVEALLEPDNTSWTPEQVAQGIVAAGDRLRAAGFRPDFIAPSTTNLAEAVRSYDRMRTVPRIGEYLKVLSYHRYSGISRAALHQLTLRARRDGLRLAMLEHTVGNADELHDDLTLGQVGAWERFALAHCGRAANPDATGVYYQIQLQRGEAPKVIFTNSARLLRHYFAFVRQGAVRIAAGTTQPDVSPVAFRNTNGALVVILRTRRGGEFSVGGLPEGRYTLLWSLKNGIRSDSREFNVASNGELQGEIPEAGFVTIYAH
ncbi:MAG: hypothetical protein ABI877_00465 [Gemmatimonadaceae bacterium]